MHNDDKSFTTSIIVDKPAHVAFEAVLRPDEWWSRDIQGDTRKQGDEFVFDVPGVHHSKQLLEEVVEDQKVVWLVTEADMTFLKKRNEWMGTRIIFEISEDNGKTKLTFTHQGLVPQIECYNACMPAWTQYIEHSLFQLITTGEGNPNLEGRTIQKPVSS